MKFHIFSVITFLLTISSLSYAQKIKKVVGVSKVKVEDHLSTAETREKAIERAKIDALTIAFGQYVEQESTIGLAKGKVDFRSYGQTKVKGEWIRTIDEPVFESLTQNIDGEIELWIKCKIRGEVRKVIPKANLEVEVLSCPQKNCRTDVFVNEQQMYLFIKSPIDGYLSIFLDDGSKIYRLLPYRRMGAEKSVEIEGDKEYILFSREIENFNTPADRIELFTSEDEEKNTLVVVFSEQEFNKPGLDNETDHAEYIIPKSLSRKEFEKWLGDNRAAFPDFLDLERNIIIKKE